MGGNDKLQEDRPLVVDFHQHQLVLILLWVFLHTILQEMPGKKDVSRDRKEKELAVAGNRTRA